MADEKIKIGQIVNAVALRGEVKVYNYSDPDRFERLDSVLVEDRRYEISKVRYQAANVILKLKGVDDRNAAEALKGKGLYILESELPELPEDTYYIRDLIGMEVVNEAGEKIGVLKDVLQNSAQDVYEIRLESGKPGSVPAVGEFVKDIDLEAKKIIIRPIEGLFD